MGKGDDVVPPVGNGSCTAAAGDAVPRRRRCPHCTRQRCLACCCVLTALLFIPMLVIWFGFFNSLAHKSQITFCGLNITAETTSWIEWEFTFGVYNPTISDIRIPRLQVSFLNEHQEFSHVPLEIEGGARNSVNYGALAACEITDIVLKSGGTSPVRVRCALSQYPSGVRALQAIFSQLLDGSRSSTAELPLNFTMAHHGRAGFLGLNPFRFEGAQHLSLLPSVLRGDEASTLREQLREFWWAWPNPPSADALFVDSRCPSGPGSFDVNTLLSGQSLGLPQTVGEFVRLLSACPSPQSVAQGATPRARYTMHVFNPMGVSAKAKQVHGTLALGPAAVSWHGNRTAAALEPAAVAACSVVSLPRSFEKSSWRGVDIECALNPTLVTLTDDYFAGRLTNLSLSWDVQAELYGVTVGNSGSTKFQLSKALLRNSSARTHYVPRPTIPPNAVSDCASSSASLPASDVTLGALQRVLDEFEAARLAVAPP